VKTRSRRGPEARVHPRENGERAAGFGIHRTRELRSPDDRSRFQSAADSVLRETEAPTHGEDRLLVDIPLQPLKFAPIEPDAAAGRATVDHDHVRDLLGHLDLIDGAEPIRLTRGLNDQRHILHAGLAYGFARLGMASPPPAPITLLSEYRHFIPSIVC
jgi:hypothetical protein